jgi:hypothetical protein
MRFARPVLWVTALLAVGCIGTTATAAVNSSQARSSKAHATSIAGKWSGHYSGAFSGTFTLHWRLSGSKLHGTIKLSSPSGTYGIDGSVRGRSIKFGAVGAGATYTGSVSGKSMSGTWKSPQGGGTWSAHKSS